MKDEKNEKIVKVVVYPPSKLQKIMTDIALCVTVMLATATFTFLGHDNIVELLKPETVRPLPTKDVSDWIPPTAHELELESIFAAPETLPPEGNSSKIQKEEVQK